MMKSESVPRILSRSSIWKPSMTDITTMIEATPTITPRIEMMLILRARKRRIATAKRYGEVAAGERRLGAGELTKRSVYPRRRDSRR